jgi:hypothetical protein
VTRRRWWPPLAPSRYRFEGPGSGSGTGLPGQSRCVTMRTSTSFSSRRPLKIICVITTNAASEIKRSPGPTKRSRADEESPDTLPKPMEQRRGVGTVADGDDGVEVERPRGPMDLTSALLLSYRAFLGSCRFGQLALCKYVAQTHPERVGAFAEEQRHFVPTDAADARTPCDGVVPCPDPWPPGPAVPAWSWVLVSSLLRVFRLPPPSSMEDPSHGDPRWRWPADAATVTSTPARQGVVT